MYLLLSFLWYGKPFTVDSEFLPSVPIFSKYTENITNSNHIRIERHPSLGLNYWKICLRCSEK